jgi:Zn-dependent oligopeptidase
MLSRLSGCSVSLTFIRCIRSVPHYRPFSSKSFLRFKNPSDLINSARKAISTSDELQSLLLSCNDAARTLRYADDISNALCLVADTASGIQNSNIGDDWDQACSLATHSIEQHMRSLNINERIYEKLLSFSQRGLLSEGDEHVLGMFIKDFQESLVHLPLQQRLVMQDFLHRESQAVESYLEADRHANSALITLPSPSHRDSQFFPMASSKPISANFSDMVLMLQQSESPDTRSKVRTAPIPSPSQFLVYAHTSQVWKRSHDAYITAVFPKLQVVARLCLWRRDSNTMQELIGVRREMARAAGWQSYAPPQRANINLHLTPKRIHPTYPSCIHHVIARVLQCMFTLPPPPPPPPPLPSESYAHHKLLSSVLPCPEDVRGFLQHVCPIGFAPEVV